MDSTLQHYFGLAGWPKCAVCCKPVDRLEQIDDIAWDRRIFRAYCHGQVDEATLARARTALQDGSWWLFSSAEAAHNLALLLPGAIGTEARALATHPRIAERLRQQGWGRVEVVPATLEGQVASIECLA